jgi:plastocyanin
MKRIILFLAVTLVTVGTVFHIISKISASAPSKAADENNIHMVSLLNSKADPEIVLAKIGDYVQFNAMDGKKHNLSQGSGNAVDENHAHNATGLKSGVFNSDEAYKIQFKKIGIYSFHDHNNPDIYIRVIVDGRK